jgi:hypothetical protein
MKRNAVLKKILTPIITLVLLITLVPVAVSCGKIEPVFGKLIICESFNKDTFEPINPKNEFDLFSKEIGATINIKNIKGTDNFRFLWKNTKTAETIADVTGKYMEGETRYLEGWFASNIFVAAGKEVIAIPGEYTVEFYHNGELKTSADFIIKEPESKVLSVSLANAINDKMEPVKNVLEFSSTDKIYVCVQMNYLIPGNKINVKWLDDKGNIILESSDEPKEPFYAISWWASELARDDGSTKPAGNYKVEIYLNGIKYNEYSFLITAPVETTSEQTQAGGITFDKSNTFTEAESKYLFTIKYPDSCNYTWTEDNTGMSATFTPLKKDDAYTTLMIVLNKSSAPKAADYDTFADELAKQSASGTEGMVQVGDKTVASGKLPDGTAYKEYSYYFNDKDKLEYGLIFDLIAKNGNLYIWYGFAGKAFYDQLNGSFYGSLATLVFNK